jgi:hypothetical protein
MHRSGTSLLARLLNLAGLYLGRPEDMLPANPTNPDGHWEHEGIVAVNEQLLAAFGGGWDLPPNPRALDDHRRIARFEEVGRAHLAGFEGHAPWGWKDPRNSLTLPFWRRLVGPLHVVVCVRNPLEVALSLRMRNGSTIAFGLALWAAYTDALLQATTRDERIVTHYQHYISEPAAEVGRIASRIGLEPDAAQWDDVRGFVRHDRRHSHFTARDLRDVNVASSIARLYQGLCIEAGAIDEITIDDAVWSATTAPDDGEPDVPGRFDYDAMEQLRRRSG